MPLPPTIIQTLLPNVCTPFTLEVKLRSLALTLRALAQLVGVQKRVPLMAGEENFRDWPESNYPKFTYPGVRRDDS